MSDRRFTQPPPGFVALRESDLYPDGGRADRWVGRGILGGQPIIRAGLRSYSACVRSLWFAYDDHAAKGLPPLYVNVAEVDSLVAEALARKRSIRREMDSPTMRDSYTVALNSFDHMRTDLVHQMVTDAGSIRRLSKIIDVPRSTLGAWIKRAKEAGTWPK